MANFILKKGLNLPLAGVPKGVLQDAGHVTKVAALGRDCPGVRPRLLVAEGDAVRRGQPIMADKNHPDIVIVSPGGGVVESINRGERRVLQSVIICLDRNETVNQYPAIGKKEIDALNREEVRTRLLSSGAWASLRRRPFGGVPSPQENPSALFVTAHDTQPLAPPISVIMAARGDFLDAGLAVLRRLFDGPLYFCSGESWNRSLPNLSDFHHSVFSGPHPAGNAGTHIHYLHPADKNRPVWYLDLQDVLAVGELFVSGVWPVERIVSLGGPGVKDPRLLRVRQGADLEELLRDELHEGSWRIISGSVLSGHGATSPEHFLGRFHQQISVIEEDLSRSFLGWVNPFPMNLFSLKRLVLGAWLPRRPRSMTTSCYGGVRAMVPSGSFERVMPLHLMPTFLLRALLAGDIDDAEALGCLELVEEDLALCTVVCPSKIEYGALLRKMLDQIEKEG